MGSARCRVAITGIGVVTPIGVGVAALWCSLRAERAAIRRLTRFDASAYRSQLAAEIDGFDPAAYADGKQARRLDRCSALAVAAGRLALADAGIPAGAPCLRRAGIALGSALGGVASAEDQYGAFAARGLRGVEPSLAVTVFGGAGATNLALALDIRGPTLGNANSCASGAVAIGEAARLIQRGELDLMLAGGAEAPLAPLTFGAFAHIKAMATRNGCPTHACRPFDRERDGFVMGEGAAVLVLERWERALARGREPYAEVAGYALTNDAWDMAAPRPDGSEAARAMRGAMADAGIAPAELGYVNAHAAGTVAGDVAEARAIRAALPDTWATTPVSGTKALHGHALGATGAIETAITALALRYGWLPPTHNLREPGAGCELCHVPSGGMDTGPRAALCNAFGFGGINACLALGAADRG